MEREKGLDSSGVRGVAVPLSTSFSKTAMVFFIEMLPRVFCFVTTLEADGESGGCGVVEV